MTTEPSGRWRIAWRKKARGASTWWSSSGGGHQPGGSVSRQVASARCGESTTAASRPLADMAIPWLLSTPQGGRSPERPACGSGLRLGGGRVSPGRGAIARRRSDGAFPRRHLPARLAFRSIPARTLALASTSRTASPTDSSRAAQLSGNRCLHLPTRSVRESCRSKTSPEPTCGSLASRVGHRESPDADRTGGSGGQSPCGATREAAATAFSAKRMALDTGASTTP